VPWNNKRYESINVQFGRCSNQDSAGTMEKLWLTRTKHLHTGREKWNTKTVCRIAVHQRSEAEKQNDYLTRGRIMFWKLICELSLWYHLSGVQPALHFGGGQFSWIFIRWRHRVCSTVIQLFASGHRKFSSQHFPLWKLLSFNQPRN